MAKIVVACPTEEMFMITNELIRLSGMDAKAILTNSQNVVEDVAEEQKNGALVAVARGNHARVLKKESDIPLCEIILSGQEIAVLLADAKKMVQKPVPRIALVGFRYMFSDPSPFCSLLCVDAVIYYAHDSATVETTVHQAIDEGSDVIVGGELACLAAQRAGVPFLFMPVGRESVRLALKEAQHLLYGIEMEKKNAAEFMSLLNYSFQAIMRLDVEGKVHTTNFIAEKALKTPSDQMIGKNIRELLDIAGGSTFDLALSQHKNLYSTVVRRGNDSFIANLSCIQPLDKPEGFILSMQEFRQIVEMEEHVRITRVAQGYAAKCRFSDLKTKSPGMQTVIGNARQLAQYDVPILICGPKGSPLSAFAQSIHNASLRHDNPFVTADLMTLAPQMQTLFLSGDPDYKSQGAFSMAYNGTLFIKDVDRLEIECQHQLLSVLKNGRLLRKDGTRIQPVNTAIVCTSSEDLRELVRDGAFLDELYQEINTLTLNVPALRERAEDIPLLLDQFLDEYTREYRKYLELTADARHMIYTHAWQGDEAQLRMFCRRIVLLCRDKVADQAFVAQNLPDVPADEAQRGLPIIVASSEEAELRDALARCENSRKHAADILGVSTTTLWRRMKKYGLA